MARVQPGIADAYVNPGVTPSGSSALNNTGKFNYGSWAGQNVPTKANKTNKDKKDEDSGSLWDTVTGVGGIVKDAVTGYVGNEMLGLDDLDWVRKNISEGNWGEAAKSLGAAGLEIGQTGFDVAAIALSGGAATPLILGKNAAKQSAKQTLKVVGKEALESAGEAATKKVLKQEGGQATVHALKTGGKNAVERDTLAPVVDIFTGKALKTGAETAGEAVAKNADDVAENVIQFKSRGRTPSPAGGAGPATSGNTALKVETSLDEAATLKPNLSVIPGGGGLTVPKVNNLTPILGLRLGKANVTSPETDTVGSLGIMGDVNANTGPKPAAQPETARKIVEEDGRKKYSDGSFDMPSPAAPSDIPYIY